MKISHYSRNINLLKYETCKFGKEANQDSMKIYKVNANSKLAWSFLSSHTSIPRNIGDEINNVLPI